MGWTCEPRHREHLRSGAGRAGPGCAIEHGRARRSESLPAVPSLARRSQRPRIPAGGLAGAGIGSNGNGDRGRGCSTKFTFAFGPATPSGRSRPVARGVRGTPRSGPTRWPSSRRASPPEKSRATAMVWTVGRWPGPRWGAWLAWRSCSLRSAGVRAGRAASGAGREVPVAKTPDLVIVHQADRLHEGVHDGAAGRIGTRVFEDRRSRRRIRGPRRKVSQRISAGTGSASTHEPPHVAVEAPEFLPNLEEGAGRWISWTRS